ncbi:MAG TPA: SurA N-terminal domain-containing protein, partial [Alphaproteobacteria bacterium]|nr:SurA N-terminal domain-containing protein [Alphaproteobacteria bacterium]
MLQAIRGQAGSWVVKILFVFLILSFAVWGIGDLFRDQGPDQVAAEVGEVEIPVAAVDRTFRQNMEQMRQLFGPEFDTEQAISLGLLDQAVETLVTGALLDQVATEQGIVTPTSAVAEEIRSQPAFQDQSGRFSRDVFLNALARNGLTEQGYVALLGREVARERIMGAVATGAAAPDTLAESLYRYRQETRIAETITLGPDLITDVPEPAESDLRSYHEDNGDRFTSPEYRTLTVVTLSAEDLADEITIGEDALREEYEARLDSYEQPETRSFDQVVLEEQATAEAVAAAARDGRTLEEAVAATEGADAAVIPLPSSSRDAMLPQLGEAGFALPKDGISDPVQSPFGWHVLQVTGIQPAGTTSFEEARPDLEAELKLDRALDEVFEVANEFEDALAGGTNLEEAAAQLGMPVIEMPPVAADGSTQDGAVLPDLPSRSEILGTAFGL